MQEFYINKNSTLPFLKMELINNGRDDFDYFYQLIQDSTITFTMVHSETGVVKISNSSNVFVSPKEDTCDDEYFIYYKWDQRDTKLNGKYYGKFTITIGDNLNPMYSGKKLIVPIQEELIIYIQ